MIGDILKTLVGPVAGVIDALHTSEEEKLQARANLFAIFSEFEKSIYDYEKTLAEERAKVLITEMQGSWLQKNWRPILMLCIVGIVVNNYLLFPYINLFAPSAALQLELPEKLWSLMQIGVGGYIVGRSGEKIVDRWRSLR